MLSAKALLGIFAALAVGFTGTYFVAGSGGGDCDGGCPISKFLGLSSDTSAAPETPCCGASKPSCCSDVTKASVGTKSSCKTGEDCASCCDFSKPTMAIVEPVGRSLPVSE